MYSLVAVSSYVDIDHSTNTVFIRMSGSLTSEDVQHCFLEYDRIIQQHFKNKKFKILLNMDEAAHDKIEILKLVRSRLENQKYKENVIAYAGVCESRSIITKRGSFSHNPNEGFFDNEEAALAFLSSR